MSLESGAASPLFRLDLFTAGCVVVRVGRAQELLDEVLPTSPLGERPFAQTSTYDLEVFKDPVAVQDVAGLHDDDSPLFWAVESSIWPGAFAGGDSTPSTSESASAGAAVSTRSAWPSASITSVGSRSSPSDSSSSIRDSARR